MKRARAFTLIELLVVIGIIALLLSILLPSLAAVREWARATKCMAGLDGISKAIMVYTNEHNGRFPFVRSDDFTTATGTRRETAVGATIDGRSITASMFLMVRGQSVDVRAFRCPSDQEALEQTAIRQNNNNPIDWDFGRGLNDGEAHRAVCYSWVAPVGIQATGARAGMGNNVTRPAHIAILADRTPFYPNYDGNLAHKDDEAAIGWQSINTEAERRANISPNHRGGDRIHVAWGDAHVSVETRADIGGAAVRDNIYTASNDDTRGSRSSLSLDPNQHLTEQDSMLIGPYQ